MAYFWCHFLISLPLVLSLFLLFILSPPFFFFLFLLSNSDGDFSDLHNFYLLSDPRDDLSGMDVARKV